MNTNTINDVTLFPIDDNLNPLNTFKAYLSRHTVVCRAAQENGARANGSEYINRNNKVAIFTHS